MRRVAAALLVAVLGLSLAACGGGESAPAKACDAWIEASNAFTANPTQKTHDAMEDALAHAVDHSYGDLRKALLLLQSAPDDASQDALAAALGAVVVACRNAGSTAEYGT